ncbi:NAD-dependent epimerase/dehydratase family protein [Actinoallomurus rhizosphaericola]|uniref:NAD-dependent epimerase/dehydratase family protein n=1 Tax=Actinoallomurus rhizosphaericola TaxID=2952536 RepID=UPI002093681E|nr:NAD-dependent epimerase/dehydratase family protein [Actinoallomurus rhizosphaericola]MCO5998392.1 NAD-dependent epimerase/dehydratase family protein [Actinoallomurus rhizosphaericola]
MRVVVTGGAGFIGANLCRELTARPGVDEVVALDDLSTGRAENLDGSGAELVEGSILDQGLMSEVLAGADAVVHLAARPSIPRSLAAPVASHAANATGTLLVLEACRRRSLHVVAASSSSVYGGVPDLPKHEDLPTRPLSPYGASKLAAEAYVLAYGASFGLPVLALRFFNVYGPLQPADHAYAAVVPTFIDAALRGEPLTVHGDGLQTRDFTYVGTVVAVLADAVLRGVTSVRPVNLAFGTRVSILELTRRLSAVLDRPVDLVHAPPRPGDVRDSQAADRRLRRLFPGVEAVPLDTGLERTVAWFRGRPAYAQDPAAH